MSPSIADRINAERVVLAGWSRAILLQIAHPLVAAGVADHSGFRRGLPSAAVRLHHTVGAMRRLAFGDTDTARRALDGIRSIHRRVNGHLRDDVGAFPAGTRYSAEDPSLVLWVHATLLDSLALVYDRIVATLTDEERDAWCRQSAPVARALGATDEVPECWHDLQAYLARMHASGAIVVGPTARTLACDVLAPRGSAVVAPARWVNRTITVGLLPADVRQQYGFDWTAGDEVRLTRLLATARAVRAVMPRSLAHWPEARARVR